MCFTLRIPREKVHVISEYAWGFRVNYMYVPLNLEDERAFNEELKRYGIENEMAHRVSGQLLSHAEKENYFQLGPGI